MVEDKLNLTYYKGTDSYSDGDVEDEILKAVEDYGDPVDLLMKESSWPFLYHLSPIRENLLEWYDFDPQGSLLEIGSGCGAVTGLFCRKLRRVVGIDLSKRRSLINATRNRDHDNLEIMVGNFEDVVIEEKFDYVTLIGVLEYSIYYIHGDRPFETMLEKARSFLKPGGKLIIAIENKYGLKYWNGAGEDHTGRLFDGLHNYKGVEKVRTFSRDGLEGMLKAAGFTDNQFYYPMPDYKLPDVVFSDSYLPEPGSLRHTSVSYDRERYKFFDEAEVYDGICEDGKFPFFANSFLVISAMEDEETRAAAADGAGKKEASDRTEGIGEIPGTTVYAKFNRGRVPEFQTETSISQAGPDRYVVKKALQETGKGHINDSLRKRDLILNNYPMLKPVDTEINPEKGYAVFPYIKGQNASELLLQDSGDPNRLIASIRELADRLLTVSEEARTDFVPSEEFMDVFGDYHPEKGEQCPGVAGANIDLIFDNLILCDDTWYVIDYEWTFFFVIPEQFIRYRAFYYFYDHNFFNLKDRIELGTYLRRLGISTRNQEKFRAMEEHFLQYVHGKDRLYAYTSRYEKADHDMLSFLRNSVSLDGDIRGMHKMIKDQRKEIKDLKRTNRDLKRSLSWRITKPVRSLADFVTRK